MLPKTTINRSWKVDVSDNRCSIDCEYCTDDAFDIDDLLLNSEESLRSFITDPREAVLEGNCTELYVENVIERNPNKCDMKSSSPRKGRTFLLYLQESILRNANVLLYHICYWTTQ